MYKISLILMSILVLHSAFATNKVHRYQDEVLKVCNDSKMSKLLLKKSLIELVNDQECNGIFVPRVLESCTKLNCKQLLDIYWGIDQVRPGAVVGEGR